MDTSASEWSSGCESGWTHYLDESFQSQRGSRRTSVYNQGKSCKAIHEDEEDLSMVSDASSGPPHFNHEEEGGGGGIKWFQKAGLSSSSSSSKEKCRRKKAKDLYLEEDTASSPAFSYPMAKSYMDSSSNQLGFWQISNPKRLDSAEQPSVIFGGRRRRG